MIRPLEDIIEELKRHPDVVSFSIMTEEDFERMAESYERESKDGD